MFVPTAYVGSSNTWDSATGKPILPIMEWPRLRALADSGWEMAGHTRTHPHLESLDDAVALAEISGGRADLESGVGAPVQTFCYPFGTYGPNTPALVRNAGFLAACTTKSGLARAGMDPFL
ncbi:MAG: polysaccharide deacetylase family protein, partial [Acidobacteriota bacterium]